MKQLNKALAVLGATLALTSSFVAHAQSDQQMDAQVGHPGHVEMTHDDGIQTKADAMKADADKMEKMQKNDMTSMGPSDELLKKLYRGR